MEVTQQQHMREHRAAWATDDPRLTEAEVIHAIRMQRKIVQRNRCPEVAGYVPVHNTRRNLGSVDRNMARWRGAGFTVRYVMTLPDKKGRPVKVQMKDHNYGT